MKKTVLLFVLSLGMIMNGFAQVAINETGAEADPSAILDLSSSDKGFLVPRVTTTERNAIGTTQSGLLVYDTSTESFWFYDNTQATWVEIANDGSQSLNDLNDAETDLNSVFLGGGSGANDDGFNYNTATGRLSLSSNTSGRFNNAFGYMALANNTVRDNNSAFGYEALKLSTGFSNTAMGSAALLNNTTGSENVAVGWRSLLLNTTADGNVAVGSRALEQDTTGDYNTAVGYYSMFNNKNGAANAAYGYYSMYSNTEGEKNTAVGFNALYENETGNYNVAIGAKALYLNTDRSNLVAIGDSALYNNGVGASGDYEATENTAIGSKALFSNATGHKNTAEGVNTLYSNMSGYRNTANGYEALYNNTSGYENTASGSWSLYHNTTGVWNTASGRFSLLNNTTGNGNAAFGNNSLNSNTSAHSNVAIGISSLYSNTTRSNLVAIGDSALYNNGIGTSYSSQATANTAVGSKSLYANTTGYKNTAIGFESLSGNTTAEDNTAIGYYSLHNNTTGGKNVAIGSNSMDKNTTGIMNTSTGVLSGRNNISGSYNTNLGYLANAYNQTGNNNTAVGMEAGKGVYGNSISGCVFLGYNAGKNNAVSNKLYIANSSTSTPLIGGDFSIGQVDINGTIKITGGTPGDGKVLTSDVYGLATWETPATYANALNDLTDAITDNTSIFIGDQVGTNDDGTNYNTALGDEAFKTNTSGQHNTAFGYKTLENSNGGSNSAFGLNALRYNTSGGYNTAIGRGAVSYNQTGSNNTAIGYSAGLGSSGNSYSGCVFIGYEAGKNNSSDNKLYIDNSSTSTPLIGGDFDTDQLYFNASRVGIGTDSPNELMEVASSTGNRARMIVSDGEGASRKVILFVSPSSSYDYGRIDAYDYNSGTGKTLRINTVGNGDIMSGGNIIPEAHKAKSLGASGTAWDNVYADDFINEGAAAFHDISVTKQLLSFKPQPKKAGAKDEFTDKGLKELDPSSLPVELCENNALLIDEMTTYNYKANYEQQLQIEQLKKENTELKLRLEKLEKLLMNN